MTCEDERIRTFRKVQQLGFIMTELGLYLNNQPCCIEAMELFDMTRRLYAEARENYEHRFGPLTYEGIKTERDGWSWINEPWPWEGED